MCCPSQTLTASCSQRLDWTGALQGTLGWLVRAGLDYGMEQLKSREIKSVSAWGQCASPLFLQQPTRTSSQQGRTRTVKVNNPFWRRRPQNTREKGRERARERAGYLCGAAEVIVVDLFYGLEVDHALQLGLVLVCRGKQRSWFRAVCFSAPPCCSTVVHREIVSSLLGTITQFEFIGQKKHITLWSKGNVRKFSSRNSFGDQPHRSKK